MKCSRLSRGRFWGHHDFRSARLAIHNSCYTDPVANVTLTLDDELLRSARKLAIDLDSSVNQMVREYLQKEVRHASRKSIAKARLLNWKIEHEVVAWTRDEIYER